MRMVLQEHHVVRGFGEIARWEADINLQAVSGSRLWVASKQRRIFFFGIGCPHCRSTPARC